MNPDDEREQAITDTDRALEHIDGKREPNDRPATPVYSHVWLDHLRAKSS